MSGERVSGVLPFIFAFVWWDFVAIWDAPVANDNGVWS